MEKLRLQGFRVHELSASEELPSKSGRRDFYKMGLINGDITIDHGGDLFDIKGTALFFVNPNVPHSVVRRINRTSGYACLFTESFLDKRAMRESPLFSIGDSPVIPLNENQTAFIITIFQKMLSAYHQEYVQKGDLIRTCIALIIHEALSIQPPQNSLVKNGASRIAHLFMDLLERQFPIERSVDPLKLRTAKAFAEDLSVHVNYLNRAVKQVTGKTTSVHIATRIITEAKALLLYTDWSVAEIGYALGFDYPAYFNNYFKRATGTSPNAFRKV